jgi:hypothetical protein
VIWHRCSSRRLSYRAKSSGFRDYADCADSDDWLQHALQRVEDARDLAERESA